MVPVVLDELLSLLGAAGTALGSHDPATGERLQLVATLPIPFEGQAIAWDPKEKRLLWGISRKDRKAIAVRIAPVK